MSARKKLGNVKAVGDVDGLPELGKLVTYSMPDDPRSGTKLVRVWAKHGLNVDDLPDQRQGFHIFQSACRSVETRRRNGKGVEIKVDEVMHDANECVYQITRMVRDEGERVIEHPKAMTIAFDKSLDKITVRELEDYEMLRGLEERIRDHYAKNAKSIPGQKIRNAVRDTLLKLGAQNMRRKAGGLYFVPATYRMMDTGGQVTETPTMPTLDGLTGALEELYGDRGELWTIPLIRDDAAESMVAKHFAINVAEKSRDLMERALQRVRQGQGTRGVRADLIANLYNERRKIAGAVSQFEELVALDKVEIEKNLHDLDDALAKLQELADAE